MRDLKRKILMNKQKGVNQNGITPKINCIAYAGIAFYSIYQTVHLDSLQIFHRLPYQQWHISIPQCQSIIFFNQDVFHDNLLGFIKKQSS